MILKLRFCEKDAKILWKHHLRFVLCSNGQTYGGDFSKFCGLLRMYELYTLYCGTKMWKHDAKNVDKQKVLGCKSVFRASIQVDVFRDQPIKLILVVSTSEFHEKDHVFFKIIPLSFCRTSVSCKIDWLKNQVWKCWTKTRIPRWKMGILVPYYFKNFNILTTINTVWSIEIVPRGGPPLKIINLKMGVRL